MDRSTDRLVYYAYSAGSGAARAARQLVTSVESLRAKNHHVPVRVVAYGALPEEARAKLAALGVRVDEAGDYEAAIGAHCPRPASRALAEYPCLQKWIGLAYLLHDERAERVLYLDSDTVLSGDVDALFDRYREHDFYAREESFSRRSSLGYRPDHVDEQALAAIAADEGARGIDPCNAGVILFNHGAWRELARRTSDLLRTVLRFTLWLADNAAVRDPDVASARADRAAISDNPLPYPSPNGWLKDQIALWLVLGRIPRLRQGFFERADVLQGSEFEEAPEALLVHYFSVNEERFTALRASRPARAARDVGDFFRELGARVDEAYRAAGYDEARFPEIAEAALAALPPADHLGEDDVLQWLFTARELPAQLDLDLPFGQPAVQVFTTSRFYVEVLHWLDGTTTIHQHAFNGAFHVLAGSSVHATYRFAEERRYGAHLSRGRLDRDRVELLRRGDARRIVDGGAFIHSLFHLDRPSVSVVVRTHHVPSGPQLTYERSGLAHDPFHRPAHLARQIQGLATLVALDRPTRFALLERAYAEADPFSFARLALAAADLDGDEDRLRRGLEAARARHGDLVDTVAAVLAERRRQRLLVALRAKLRSADHRFFLALMLHFDEARPILDLVRARSPDRDPEETVLGWMRAVTALPDPEDPRRRVFDFTLDDPTLEVARAMIGGRALSEVLSRLARDFGDADVAAQAAEIEAVHRALRGSRLFGPLFR